MLIGFTLYTLAPYLVWQLFLPVDFIKWIGAFAFYIGLIIFFILILAHVGLLRS
ncbi:MAG: hypothetical protein ACFE9D_12220 [Promethearchaeota archaeon]